MTAEQMTEEKEEGEEEEGEEAWGLVPVGLRNQDGENNCFLNSVIQVLWHLDVFRRDFHQLCGHACLRSSCIFCALKVLFTQFEFTDDACLPPDVLRQAMSISFSAESRFQLGEMDDAAECFEKILSRIHYHVTGSDESEDDVCCQPSCITHRKFVTRVTEEMVCQCGATYGRLTFNQTVCYVSASSIKTKASRSFLAVRDDQLTTRNGGGQPQLTMSSSTSTSTTTNSNNNHKLYSFGHVLKDAMDNNDDDDDNARRTCPKVGCRGPVRLRRTMLHCPEVLSIGLIWEMERPSSDDIEALTNLISTTIDPTDLFDGVDSSYQKAPCKGRRKEEENADDDGLLSLTAIVCYYGKHYSTFLFDRNFHEWLSIDDSSITQIGQWMNVLTKCVRGRYQPLLLIYSKQHSTPISRHLVPKDTWFPPSPSPYSKTITIDPKTTNTLAPHDSWPPPRPSSARPPKRR